MSVNVSPIAGLMAGKVGRKVVARYLNCCKGTGRRDQLTKGEERLHALVFSASADWKCLASTPALARCAQVIVGPFAPYTFTNWALAGRPARANRRVSGHVNV